MSQYSTRFTSLKTTIGHGITHGAKQRSKAATRPPSKSDKSNIRHPRFKPGTETRPHILFIPVRQDALQSSLLPKRTFRALGEPPKRPNLLSPVGALHPGPAHVRRAQTEVGVLLLWL
ncbi:hypothetical protein AA313_de0201403 [Arthrobotrys entomopaga]|nr:hypothetical protein AA313_de0201403 [Arthrobotrys entomopaga]